MVRDASVVDEHAEAPQLDHDRPVGAITEELPSDHHPDRTQSLVRIDEKLVPTLLHR